MLGTVRRTETVAIVSAVSGAHFLSHVYLLAYPPLFPILAREFGVSTTRLGLLVTAIYLPQLLLQLPLGDIVDRIGAKRVLLAGLTLTSLSIALSGMATSYWLLLAFATVSGIGQSVFHPADYALLDAATDIDTEGTAFSAHTFGGFAGFAAAPAVVGGIGIVHSWQLALVTVGSFGIVYALVLALTMNPIHTRRVREANSSSVRDDGAGVVERMHDTLSELFAFATQRRLLSVFVFYLLSMMAIVGIQSFTTVLAVESYGVDESTANTLLTALLVSMAVGVILGGPVADRLPYRRIIVVSFVLAGLIVWIAAGSPAAGGVLIPAIALTLAGLLIGVALPSRDKFANALADPDATGKSFGFYFTGLSLGAVVSPALLGLVIDRWSAVVAFTIVGGLLIVAVTVVIRTSGTSSRSVLERA